MKEIPGSGGIRNKEHVSFESNLDEHYALTSVGLQTLTKSSSKTLMPDTADFISARIFESYDGATKTLTTQYLSAELRIKLTVVSTRYLVISYGISSLTHALIYDTVQKKWGKVKINHVDCFQFNDPNLYGEITYDMLLALGITYDELMETTYTELLESLVTSEKPRKNIGFLQADGSVKILNFDLGQIDNSGVFIIGKFQFTRRHYVQLLGFEVECLDSGSNFAAFVLPCLDGKTFSAAVTPTLKINTPKLKTYQAYKTGQSHSLLFTGSFNLTSGLIRYAQGGLING